MYICGPLGSARRLSCGPFWCGRPSLRVVCFATRQCRFDGSAARPGTTQELRASLANTEARTTPPSGWRSRFPRLTITPTAPRATPSIAAATA